MSIVINGIKMPEAPDEKIELAIYGDGTVIQTYESWRSPEDGKCYWTVTNPEKFGNAIFVKPQDPDICNLLQEVVAMHQDLEKCKKDIETIGKAISPMLMAEAICRMHKEE